MRAMNALADFERVNSDGGATLRFTGNLSLACIGDLPERLGGVRGPVKVIDLEKIERIDTVGAWLIHRLAREHDAVIRGLEEDEEHLLEQVRAAECPVEPPRYQPGLIPRVLGEIGDAVVTAGQTLYGLLGFLGATLIAFWNVFTERVRRVAES